MGAGRARIAFETGVVGLGIEKVRIHKGRKHHPRQESRTKAFRLLVAGDQVGRGELWQLDLILSNRIQLRYILEKPVFKRADSVTIHAVRQTSVMAGYAECEDLAQ